MRLRWAALAVPAAASAAATVLAITPVPAASEPRPHCQPVLIETPWRTFTVQACDSGLRDPAPGKEWAWTVDGSALKGGAVIFGSQIPKVR
jgi:hypothetical protein